MTIPFPIEYIVFGGLFFIALILAFWVFALENRLKKLTRGKGASSLEDTITVLGAETDQLKKHVRALEQKHILMEKKIASSVRGVATVRFNPFKGSGSNQSFTTAFIDEHGDGVIISTLYSRERVSVFAKPVKQLSSQYELMDEERKALSLAHTQLQK